MVCRGRPGLFWGCGWRDKGEGAGLAFEWGGLGSSGFLPDGFLVTPEEPEKAQDSADIHKSKIIGKFGDSGSLAEGWEEGDCDGHAIKAKLAQEKDREWGAGREAEWGAG